MKKLIILVVFLINTNLTFSQTTLKKVYCLDTSFVNLEISGIYDGCQKKTIDTSYHIRTEFESQHKWEIYYDEKFKFKQSDFEIIKDTFYYTAYYRNGQKKSVERFLNYKRLYTTLWCENGQVIASNTFKETIGRHVIIYYCNGNKEFQGFAYNLNLWGKVTKWYENGQKQYENIYTEYDKDLEKQNQLENKLISEKYWDEKGNETAPFPTEQRNINMYDMPVYIPPDKLNNSYPYYEIRDQSDYANSMLKFKNLVYQTVRIDGICNCKVGQVYIRFYIEKDGTISNITIDNGLEKKIDEALVESIKQIGKWTPAIRDGEPVKVAVSIGFEIEKIKK